MALNKVINAYVHILATNKAIEVTRILYPELRGKPDPRLDKEAFKKWLGEYEHYIDYYTLLYLATENTLAPKSRKTS